LCRPISTNFILYEIILMVFLHGLSLCSVLSATVRCCLVLLGGVYAKLWCSFRVSYSIGPSQVPACYSAVCTASVPLRRNCFLSTRTGVQKGF
jgi:hypothetical protein